jgi:hypothetical protein
MISFQYSTKSLFYIAPGFDFEPLWRMSHLCDTFFYANLYYSLDQVLSSIEAQLRSSDKVELVSIEIDRSFDEITHFDLHSEFRSHLLSAYGLLSPTEQSNYTNSFVPALREDQWLIVVKLKRKSTGRPITLYYFTGEGLASYVALSKNGKYAPRVLCTIQTGVLERPNGLMTRLLQKFEQKPLLWIRGFEETHHYENYSNAFETDKLYNHIGLDFIDEWVVPVSYLGFYSNKPTRRFCKGFVTQEKYNQITAIKRIYLNKHEVHYDGIQNIIWDKDQRSCLFISRKTYVNFESELNMCDDISYWEGCIKPWEKKNSSKTCIDFLQKIDDLNKYKEIHFIPFGLEDEGELYKEFLTESRNAKFHIYLHRPLDYYDLKN